MNALAANARDLIEVSVSMEDLQFVILGAGRDEDVRGGGCDSRFTAYPRQLSGHFPDRGRGRRLLDRRLDLAEDTMLVSALGSFPQLQEAQIAKHGSALL